MSGTIIIITIIILVMIGVTGLIASYLNEPKPFNGPEPTKCICGGPKYTTKDGQQIDIGTLIKFKEDTLINIQPRQYGALVTRYINLSSEPVGLTMPAGTIAEVIRLDQFAMGVVTEPCKHDISVLWIEVNKIEIIS